MNEALLKSHPQVAILFYNLGNSYFRMGALGPAILAYERAKLFQPRDWDILYNLGHVRSLLEYRVEDKRNWYLKAFEEGLNAFTEKEVIFSVFVFYFLLMASWAWAVFFRKGELWGWKRKLLLTFTLVFVALMAAKNVQAHWLRGAIVTSPEAQIRYGPSDSDQLAFRLKEGLKLYVLDHRDEWSRVFLTNGESGWVRNDQIEEFRPS